MNPVSPGKKILILSASFGEGHNAAARGLRDAILQVYPDSIVEIRDLFDQCYGKINAIAREAYLCGIHHTPFLWSVCYKLSDILPFKPSVIFFSRAVQALKKLIAEFQPSLVLTTYPAYNYFIDAASKGAPSRPFKLVTVITDSISINSIWHRSVSDFYVVANMPSAKVLFAKGVNPKIVQILGFPISPKFAIRRDIPDLDVPLKGSAKKVLVMVGSGKRKAREIVQSLIGIQGLAITITVGRNQELQSQVRQWVAGSANQVTIHGWTDQMPYLLMSHHLVISKAGGATVQEAIAAQCPIIVNQIVPGQEEGNAALVDQLRVGAICENPGQLLKKVETVLCTDGKLWHQWKANLKEASRPGAALDIANFIMKL